VCVPAVVDAELKETGDPDDTVIKGLSMDHVALRHASLTTPYLRGRPELPVVCLRPWSIKKI